MTIVVLSQVANTPPSSYWCDINISSSDNHHTRGGLSNRGGRDPNLMGLPGFISTLGLEMRLTQGS